MRLLQRRQRHAKLDARIEEARKNAEAAQADVELSQHRYRSVRQHVVDPLHAAGSRNGFAEDLRASLADGYGGRT